MHNLKRLLPVLLAFFVVSAFAAYANGQGESSKVSGSIVSISQPTANGQVNVVLNGTNGTYTISVDQHLVTAAGLTVGKTINLTGTVHSASDGTKEVNANTVEVDGHQYAVSQTPGGTGGNPPSVAEDVHHGSTHGSAEVEKPDKSPDKASSSKDTETPDTSKS